jgi:hypothetical protein
VASDDLQPAGGWCSPRDLRAAVPTGDSARQLTGLYATTYRPDARAEPASERDFSRGTKNERKKFDRGARARALALTALWAARPYRGDRPDALSISGGREARVLRNLVAAVGRIPRDASPWASCSMSSGGDPDRDGRLKLAGLVERALPSPAIASSSTFDGERGSAAAMGPAPGSIAGACLLR